MSYDTLKVIHTLAAYVWLGSLFGSLVFATVTTRRNANGVLTGALAVLRFSTRVGLPAAVVLLIAGIWMVASGDGGALMHPAARKMRNATTDAEAIGYAKRVIWIGGGEIIAVAIAIWVMGAHIGS